MRMPRTFEDVAIFAAPGVFVVLWASGFIGAKLGLPYAEPLTFLALRMFGVVVLLAAVIVYATAELCDPLNAVGSVAVLFVGVKIATNECVLPTPSVEVESVADPLASVCVPSVVLPS